MNNTGLYKLVGHDPVPCENTAEWGREFAIEKRRVAEDYIDDVCISTVFLGMDHKLSGDVPVLFETRIFDGPLDGSVWRYATWDEAVAGHKMACEAAQNPTQAAAGKPKISCAKSGTNDSKNRANTDVND